MGITLRHYHHPDDYQLVDDFLIAHYLPGNRDGNWLEPTWEYALHHSMLDSSSLEKIGIWFDDEKIVAVAHYESVPGEAFFQFHPKYRHLRRDMLDYAEKNLFGISKKNARKFLRAYVNDDDMAFQDLVRARGYEKDPEAVRPLYRFDIPSPFPPIQLPDGYCVKSLEEDCNWAEVHRVLWRGFDHEGEPPQGEAHLEARRKMFDTPKARRGLKIVVEAPDRHFVAFCGMFYEPTHHYAYVEPVATDPDYRRMGLGKAAVLEGIRRCGGLGATMAFVGSDQWFYQAMGFKKGFHSECWLKYLDDAAGS